MVRKLTAGAVSRNNNNAGKIIMVIRGHVENGAVVLDEEATLPEGAQVRVEVLPSLAQVAETEIPTLFDRLKPVIGKAQHLPADAADNVDHYLYGQPKR
jgi:hypothetical protein